MKYSFFAFLAFLMFFASCKKEELISELTPAPSAYLSWTPGDWWVYEWFNYDHHSGDTVVRSLDTTFALADTVINGETFRALSRGMYPWQEGRFYMRDSAGYVVDNDGGIIFSYVNFTDTLENHLDSLGGWFAQMVVDSVPTVVPAGAFNTINYQFKHRYHIVACGDSVYYSDRQFALGVGLVKASYHYAAPGPCAGEVGHLVDYYVQ